MDKYKVEEIKEQCRKLISDFSLTLEEREEILEYLEDLLKAYRSIG